MLYVFSLESFPIYMLTQQHIPCNRYASINDDQIGMLEQKPTPINMIYLG